MDISQLKEHIKDSYFPSLSVLMLQSVTKKPASFSKPLSNIPCFYIFLFLEKKSDKNISCIVSILNSSFRQGLPYFFQYLALQKWIVLREEKNQPFHLVNDKILVKTCFHFKLVPVSHKAMHCLDHGPREAVLSTDSAENVPNITSF